jgi:hypothetical protein
LVLLETFQWEVFIVVLFGERAERASTHKHHNGLESRFLVGVIGILEGIVKKITVLVLDELHPIQCNALWWLFVLSHTLAPRETSRRKVS